MFKAKSFRPRLKSTKRSRCIAPPSRCRVQILPRSFRPECCILLVESCLMTSRLLGFGMLKGLPMSSLYLYNSVHSSRLHVAPYSLPVRICVSSQLLGSFENLWNLEALNEYLRDWLDLGKFSEESPHKWLTRLFAALDILVIVANAGPANQLKH